MKLGYGFQVTCQTNQIAPALELYQQFGFTSLPGLPGFPQQSRLTDGQIFYALENSEQPQITITYLTQDLGQVAVDLENVKKGFQWVPFHNGSQSLVLVSPDELRLQIIEYRAAGFAKPTGVPHSICGTFGEICIETNDLSLSEAFWTDLGFTVTFRPPRAPYLTLSDGVLVLGLYLRGHCRHPFQNPSLVYFEMDMGNRITRLRNQGITFLELMPAGSEVPQEGIVKAPDGQLWFLFSAG